MFRFLNNEGNNLFKEGKLGCPKGQCQSYFIRHRRNFFGHLNLFLSDSTMIKIIQSLDFSSTANRLPRTQILKLTIGRENLATQLFVWVNLMIEKRLQDDLGTCNTKLRVRVGVRAISPFLAITENEPLAIRTLFRPEEGKYE